MLTTEHGGNQGSRVPVDNVATNRQCCFARGFRLCTESDTGLEASEAHHGWPAKCVRTFLRTSIVQDIYCVPVSLYLCSRICMYCEADAVDMAE